MKNDTGAGVMTSQRFGANAAWVRYGVIAVNLLEAMKTLVPKEAASDHAPRRGRRSGATTGGPETARPETIRQQLIRCAGRFVRHANRLTLVLAAGASALLQAYAALQGIAAG